MPSLFLYLLYALAAIALGVVLGKHDEHMADKGWQVAKDKGHRSGGKDKKSCENASVKTDWQCKSCTNRAGKPWRNSGSLSKCGSCHIHKGASFGQVVARGQVESPTSSTRQREASLTSQVADLKKKLAQANSAKAEVPPVINVEADMDTTTATEEDKAVAIRVQLKELRGDLEHFAKQDAPRNARTFLSMGGYEAYKATTSMQITALVAELEGCKTIPQRLSAAQHKERVQTKIDKACSDDLAEALDTQKLANEAVAAAELAKQKSSVELAAAKAEVGTLAKRRADEEGVQAGAPTAPLDPDNPPEGFVAVAKATQIHNEICETIERDRTLDLQRIVTEAVALALANQLQMFKAMAADSAAPSEAPSEADQESDDDVQLEDEAWKKLHKKDKRTCSAASKRAAAKLKPSGSTIANTCFKSKVLKRAV